MRELALFAGAGGGILGGKLLGWRTVCAVEINPYCRKVLLARQQDGALERFPIWDDVTTFDGYQWRGSVDVVSGGFPCQDISAAGKGAGLAGARSGLWTEFARIIGEVQPTYVLVENSPRLTVRGLDIVLGDLATLGYDAKWGVVSAENAGAPHRRERIWIVANNSKKRRPWRASQKVDRCDCNTGRLQAEVLQDAWNGRKREVQGESQCGICRVDNGVGKWVDRIEAIGNGQVPHCMALAWTILCGEDT